MDLKSLFSRLQESSRGIDFLEMRAMRRFHELLAVRQGVAEPPYLIEDLGIMLTVFAQGGAAYVATADLTDLGLKNALLKAKELALFQAKYSTIRFTPDLYPQAQGVYRSRNQRSWQAENLKGKYDTLKSLNNALKSSDSRIVDWGAQLTYRRHEIRLLSSLGTDIEQTFDMIQPNMSVTAHDKGTTEFRSFGGDAFARQGGLEVLEEVKFEHACDRIREQALALVYADQCPTEVVPLLLAPDQMILQIHESIGHPLELDRILGDERNYAGTSFVKPEMFGKYQYGSSLLNVTFDPNFQGQLASYNFDDQGTPAEKVFLIKEGLLITGLGGVLSQKRSGLPGVANSRSVSWNRPPIDRMANINVEPGSSSLQDMISSVDRGVYMETNCSWSIDDSRNKFQFGCEYGRLIENGKLGKIVRKPNYRGISAEFWRNLVAVGNRDSMETMGTPNCGKGEPNQAITVGHASPACLFKNIQVFGGDS